MFTINIYTGSLDTMVEPIAPLNLGHKQMFIIGYTYLFIHRIT